MNNLGKNTVYQIYPKSFKDSNGDGIGDLNGIIEKLDYLKELGVDYLWITPFYKSPLKDNGYDISDYYSVDEKFGSMEDFDTLIEECNKRDIKIMLDMVFNHTSTEHKWFKEALNGNKKYKDYYIFRKGKDGLPPTNWVSKFGGSAWEYVEKYDEYYLHLFDVTQADLNWDNPRVREEIYNVIKFWMEKGVKGFRLDVINLISKPLIFEDDFEGDGRRFYTDGPRIHEYLKELNEKTFSLDNEIITVGEMSSTSLDNCVRYANPDEKELSMVFNFHHLKVDYKDGEKWSIMDYDFMKLKSLFKEWQDGMQNKNSWNALFWSNHDQPRVVSRFGDEGFFHSESAKMLGTAQFLMRGTPYIYQGEEIGMTNANFNSIEEYKDIESINYYNILRNRGVKEEEIIKILKSKSRDNGRTPMQWSDDENGGFCKVTPWISTCKRYKDINVEAQRKDDKSVLAFFKALINVRKEYDVVANGNIKFLFDDNKSVLAYLRENNKEKMLVLCNFYDEIVSVDIPKSEFNLKDSRKIIGNYEENILDDFKIILKPYEASVYYVEK